MISRNSILDEIRSQEKYLAQGSSKTIIDELLQEDRKEGLAEVDVLTYVKAEWGLNERPYPIQRFLMKLLYALPLDDRFDDEVVEVVSPTEVKVRRIEQFDETSSLDIAGNKGIRVVGVNAPKKTLIFESEPAKPLKAGDPIFARINIFDKFREKIIGSFTESEFLEFLYAEGPGTENCRISVSPADYEKRVKNKEMMSLVILRIGRRGTKTTISQWVAAYEAYKIMRKYYPQEYYRMRRDQAVSMTLIATGEQQAQDLLAPARSAIKRSPFLKRYVVSDSARKMTLNTPFNIDNGLDAENGLKIIAAPCSAKAVRGPANLMVLMEEYGTFYWELSGSNKSDRAIYNAISPSLADLKDPKTGEPAGRMLIISTPLTKEAHMYYLETKTWEAASGVQSELKNSMVVHLPSFWTNRLLTATYLKQEYELDPVGFRQEYEAYYSDQKQAAFTRDQIELIVKPREPGYEMIKPGEVTYMGFDLGLKNDPTSISIVAMNHEGRARLIHHETIGVRESDIDFIDTETGNTLDIVKVARRIDTLWRMWAVKKGLGDQWNSLAKGTMILTTDGDKRIEDVLEGDSVLSKDGNWHKVTQTITHPYRGILYNISIEGQDKTLDVTWEHDLYVWNFEESKWEWKSAREVVVGDLLCTILPDKKPTYLGREILEIKTNAFDGDVHDLRVEDENSFHAEGVVVHNCYGLKPHLKESKANMDLHDINATINDKIARCFLGVLNQRHLTIYADKEEWEDKTSLVRELTRLQRTESGGTSPRIKIEAPNLQGAHDDQYSSLSRAVYLAQQDIIDRPPALSLSPELSARNTLIRENAEALRRSHSLRNNRNNLRGRR